MIFYEIPNLIHKWLKSILLRKKMQTKFFYHLLRVSRKTQNSNIKREMSTQCHYNTDVYPLFPF